MRTVPLITGKIMESLSDGCHLRRLSIVNGELSDITVNLMCNVIKKASFLIELDISANNITSSRMLQLSSVLAENRKLQILNLSWNFLVQPGTVVNSDSSTNNFVEKLFSG